MKEISENNKPYTTEGNIIVVSFKTCNIMLTYGTRFFSISDHSGVHPPFNIFKICTMGTWNSITRG